MVAVVLAAEERDLDAMVELLRHLFEQEVEFCPDAKRQRVALTQLVTSPELGSILVAKEAGRCIGMVSLLFTISTAEGGSAAWLEDMVVLPEYRGVGVGGKLLDAAIEDCRQRGIHRITLLTDHANDGAQRFYRQHGFTPSPMLPFRRRC